MNDTAPITDPSKDTTKLKWYVVHTFSGFENKVKLALEERIKQNSLDSQFGNIIIPTEMVEEVKVEEKNGKTVTKRRQVKRKAAPGYIFVHMEMTSQTFSVVKNTQKVTGFIGAPSVRAAMHDSDLKRIPAVPEREVLAMTQQLTEASQRAPTRVDFDIGDNVRVIEGNFANFNGVVSEVNSSKQKVRVIITIFGRGTPVELDFHQVQKL
jgi:transcription termination/antitermination protein NusG